MLLLLPKIVKYYQPSLFNDDKQMCAEVLHTNFIVQHNISFLTADRLAPLYRVKFPGSNIAKNIRCRRTKTT